MLFIVLSSLSHPNDTTVLIAINGATASLAVKVTPAGEATLPSFDHGVGDPVPDGVTVIPQNKIILVEGNYLLLGGSYCFGDDCDAYCFMSTPHNQT